MGRGDQDAAVACVIASRTRPGLRPLRLDDEEAARYVRVVSGRRCQSRASDPNLKSMGANIASRRRPRVGRGGPVGLHDRPSRCVKSPELVFERPSSAGGSCRPCNRRAGGCGQSHSRRHGYHARRRRGDSEHVGAAPLVVCVARARFPSPHLKCIRASSWRPNECLRWAKGLSDGPRSGVLTVDPELIVQCDVRILRRRRPLNRCSRCQRKEARCGQVQRCPHNIEEPCGSPVLVPGSWIRPSAPHPHLESVCSRIGPAGCPGERF